MPRIDPQQLLNCLSVLLAPNGGIKSEKEVNRLALLMGKFSKKLVSKCIYIQILKSTETELLGQFMTEGGWALSHTWLQDGILSRNWPLVQELLELLLLCPVDIQRLKCNSAPKLVKGLSKEGGNEGVRILASKLVEQWLKIVKGESSPSSVIAPRQDVIVAVLKPEISDMKQEIIESSENLLEEQTDQDDDMVDPLEIPSNHVPQEDKTTKERLAKAKSDGLVFKITVKDGKQVLAKVEASPKKENDLVLEKVDKKTEQVCKPKTEPIGKAKSEAVTKVKNEIVPKIKTEAVGKLKSEPITKVKSESIANVKNEPVEVKKEVKEKIKKEIVPIKEQDKKIEKPKKDAAKEKSKTDEKSHERRSSKESKETKDTKDVKDSKESSDVKDSKEKDRKKDSSSSSKSSSSSSSSSKHRSSSHKSSRSSSDSKHKSSSSSSSSRDKEKDSEKNKDRSSKSSSSSGRSSSSSRNNSSSSKSNQPREKRDSLDEKSSQSTRDKDTLSKVTPPSINKLGKIPKKTSPPDAESPTETTTKKSSISIEIKKDTENRPKTVKTYNSQFRSHGLAEEAPPPPSRRGLQRPSSQPTTGTSIPANIVSKRLSPPPEKKDAVVPEKKLKLDSPVAEKPGIKLIPAKPKTPVLVDSDMFMDAIFASRTKKDSIRKRKRTPSLSNSDPTKPDKVQSPDPKDSKSVAPKFYQDTLDDNEAKDEERSDQPTKKNETSDATKEKESSDGDDVEMQENNELNENQNVEAVVVVERKPPGPGCGPNGPPGVLTTIKRKGPKKQLKWRTQEFLEEIRYFELDENERVNVSRNFVDMTQKERFGERDAFLIARKMNSDDLMAEQIEYTALYTVDNVPVHPDGSNSKEKKIQADRELTCLKSIYFDRSMIPDSPAEPDMEQYQITDPPEIPLDDANGNPDGIKNSSNIPWPEPKGSPPHQAIAFEDQQFSNFQSNFAYNNPTGWNPPNVMASPFNGPSNMLHLNTIQPDVMNNINMNQMPQFQQNANFGPSNGLRNNFGGNFRNNDGRSLQNNGGWFRPNGPVAPQNNWRPPMGNNNNRPRLEWIPRNVCRAFAKGFCRNGDKCQWLHPGINCPPI